MVYPWPQVGLGGLATEESHDACVQSAVRWSVWEQIMPTSEGKAQYADATQKVASFSTVQDFWRPIMLLKQRSRYYK